MKRILFIALILTQALMSVEGVLFAKSEKVLTVEQEAKSETIDEPEILEHSRVKLSTPPVYCSFVSYANRSPLVLEAVVIPQQIYFSKLPLFILHGGLRT